MEKMRNSVFILLLICGLISCKKESSTGFTVSNNLQINDTTWSNSSSYQTLVKSITNDLSIAPLVANTSFTSSGIEDDKDIFNSDNFRLSVSKNSLFNPITNKTFTAGKLTINLLALNTNGDFIRNYSSSFINNQQNQSIGFYNLNFYANDTLLSVKQGNNIHLYVKDSLANNSILHNINVFQSSDNDITDNNFLWYNDSSASHNLSLWNVQGTNNHKGYDISIAKSGWVSLLLPGNGQIINNTKINVFLPVNFTNKNTLVYAVKAGSKNVARLNADFTSRTFSLSNIPYNQNITLVTISKIDHKYYLGTVTSNYSSHQDIFNVVPLQVTIANIIDYLNTL